jgi:hypothetical protein
MDHLYTESFVSGRSFEGLVTLQDCPATRWNFSHTGLIEADFSGKKLEKIKML